MIKGEFSVSRVEVVETMAYEVFHRENVLQVPRLSWHILVSSCSFTSITHLPSPPLPSPPPQVGDDDEVMYLVAPSAKECSQWVAALQKGVSVSERWHTQVT